MPKISDKPLTRICTRLYTEDLEFLDELSRASGEARDLLIRNIVHNYRVRAGDRLRRKIDEMEK